MPVAPTIACFGAFSNASTLKRNNEELGYATTRTVFVPKLKKAGASDEILRQIIDVNRRRGSIRILGRRDGRRQQIRSVQRR